MRLLAAHAHQTARISFLDTLSLFKDSQCARKLETRTQYKADGVCFPVHPAAGLVGRHSSILADPFIARGLAICYEEITLPDQGSESDAKPAPLPVHRWPMSGELRWFARRFSLRFSEPFCDGVRIKPHAGADAKGRDTSCFSLFENRDSRNAQQVGEFNGCQSVRSLFDYVSKRCADLCSLIYCGWS